MEKGRCPARIVRQQFLIVKAKSVRGFEPGVLGQNGVAIPPAPPPLPSLDTIFKEVPFQSGFVRILG